MLKILLVLANPHRMIHYNCSAFHIGLFQNTGHYWCDEKYLDKMFFFLLAISDFTQKWAEQIFCNKCCIQRKLKGAAFALNSHLTRPTLERRKTLGHLRSINPNMIPFHQPITDLLTFENLETLFFKYFMKRNCEKWFNQSKVELI